MSSSFSDKSWARTSRAGEYAFVSRNNCDKVILVSYEGIFGESVTNRNKNKMSIMLGVCDSYLIPRHAKVSMIYVIT